MPLFWAERVAEETSKLQSPGVLPSPHPASGLWLGPRSPADLSPTHAPGERWDGSKKHQEWVLGGPEECHDVPFLVSTGIARDLLSEREL